MTKLVSDRERAVLIGDICKRLGTWGEEKIYNRFSQVTMDSIRADAERLVELLDARELGLLRKQGVLVKRDLEEEG